MRYPDLSAPRLAPPAAPAPARFVRFASRRVDAERHILTLSSGGGVLDRFGADALLSEVLVTYERGGAESNDVGSAYPEYRRWRQRSDLSGFSYWNRALEELPPPTSLSLRAFPGEPIGGSNVGYVAASSRSDVARRVDAFLADRQMQLLDLVRAAWAVLLHGWTGADRVAFGLAIDARPRGRCLTVLPVASRVQSEQSAESFLAATRDDNDVVVRHSHALELLAPGGEHVSPPFESLIGVADTRLPATINVRRAVPAVVSTEHPLEVAVRLGDAIHVDASFDVIRFHVETAQAIVDQLAHLVEELVVRPQLELRDYSLVTAADERRLPDPARPIAVKNERPVTETIHDWCRRTPAATAVAAPDRSWTYGELERAVACVCRRLGEAGAETGEVVAVRGTGSFGTIASLLAILSRGGIALMLDAATPPDRAALFLREAGCAGVIETQPPRLGPEARRASRWILEVSDDQLAVSPDPDPWPCAGDGGSAAYVFFTSGTTRRPRGILGTHRGLAHFIRWQRETFAIGPGDRFAQFTPPMFDVFLRDALTPLSSGATVCIPPEGGVTRSDVVEWLDASAVTHMHLVPSIARFVIEGAGDDAAVAHVRALFFAGEPLDDELVRRWRRACPNLRDVVNLYGPTETTLAKCFFRVPSPPVEGIQPVGHALPGAEAIILRNRSKLCGVGEIGHIAIRTPYRTLGYLASDASSSSFFPNPFRRNASDVLFSTGDLGRYLPDGAVEFLGRHDDVVKVHGVRIDPSEIKANLVAHDAVADCSVLAISGDDSVPALVAFVVAHEPVSRDELRAFLMSGLPHVMIPSEFVFIGEIPLTPNGKTDREALRHLYADAREPQGPRAAATTEMEDLVAAIWEDLLDVKDVGVRDNFFELGGHSLLATRVVSRIRSALGVELPLRTLFETPTVADVAAMVEKLSLEEQAELQADEVAS
jgi:amino acid adenylation domain-containing protein